MDRIEQARKELPDIEYCDDPYECVKGADAMVIVTEWVQYRALDWDRIKAGMVEMNGKSRGRGAPFGGTKASGRAREGGVDELGPRGGLEAMQRFEKRLERPRGERPQGMRRLVPCEGLQPIALVDRFGFVGEQHGVTIECDAYLVGVAARRLRGLRIYARRGTFGIQRAHHVRFVRRQEQIRLQ